MTPARPRDANGLACSAESGRATPFVLRPPESEASPDGTPLVIDSTGSRHKDSNEHAIPCGIHLRPFEKGSWYHQSFNHAHRWIR
jgi:hypothetical protein